MEDHTIQYLPQLSVYMLGELITSAEAPKRPRKGMQNGLKQPQTLAAQCYGAFGAAVVFGTVTALGACAAVGAAGGCAAVLAAAVVIASV